MTTHQLERPTRSERPPGEWARRAWLSVTMIPVFFLVTFAISYALYDVFGYAPEDSNAPLWVDLLIAAVGVAVFLVPCVAAMVYGRLARRSGYRRGLLPAGIGAVAGSALVVLTIATTVGDALG